MPRYTTRSIVAAFVADPTLVAKAAAVSCRGGWLFSYAEPIGQIIMDRGTRTARVTSRKFSRTTTRHTTRLLVELSLTSKPGDLTINVDSF